MKWSSQQEAIFAWFKKGAPSAKKAAIAVALVVRARAGTGKTSTIIAALEHAPEEKILLCAFNKRIATELQEKLPTDRAEAKTLHSLGFGFIRKFWERVRVDNRREFEIAKEVVGAQAPDDMVAMVAKLSAKGKEMAPEAECADDLVELAEQFECLPDEEWEEYGWNVQKVCEHAFTAMLRATEQNGKVSFADMLYLPLRNKWVRGRYDLVIVDEAQDMNRAQLLLAQRVVKKGGRIAVVGDDRQAIYGFRGADSKSLDRLKEAFNAVESGLTITYRCPKLVVAEAARLVPDYVAADSAPEGVVRSVSRELAYEKEVQEGDFVLSRTNAPLVGGCLRLLRQGKRARIEGRDIGKGLVALVKKWKSAKSIPRFLERLEAWKEREIHRASSLKRPEARIDLVTDQAETLIALAEGLSGLKELEARIEALFSDSTDGPNGKVVFSTVHKAKGLEKDRVFILRSTLGRRKPKNADEATEEANIEYVAITRAKRELVWIED